MGKFSLSPHGRPDHLSHGPVAAAAAGPDVQACGEILGTGGAVVGASDGSDDVASLTRCLGIHYYYCIKP